jgi:3-deoxy-D-manno-octulosonic-acid transferase
VSVGEVQAAVPLVRALRQRYPAMPVVMTTSTPTGAARVAQAFGGDVKHTYLPYDLPGALRRFLARARPRLAVIMETELWPNLFHECRVAGIPLIVANARMSARSAAGYQRVRRLTQRTLDDVTLIAAQSGSDAERFAALGADPARLAVTGSLKFEVRVPGSLQEEAEVLRRSFGAQRPVWIAASTHAGEDEQVLDAFAQLRRALPDAMLVLVPRHPERFEAVAALCRARGYRVETRSGDKIGSPKADIFLGDTMGELLLFFAAGDIAFIGGSLIPHGGHNPLEASALGVPVIFGPHFFNFEEIGRLLVETRAAVRVNDARMLAMQLHVWFKDVEARNNAGDRGRQVVEANRGTLDALVARIAALLRA